MIVYCSNCGKGLPIFRKASSKYGRIFDLVEPHICADHPIELNLKPIPLPVVQEVKGKFVQNLDELEPPPLLKATEPGDSRPPEHVKASTSAPPNLLKRLRQPDD